jgi:DNA-binding XRE family transcriptional regulator
MDRIRQLRKERGLSQAKLAVMADMDPATLNRLEQGKGNPNLKTLERVASALGVEVVDLFPKREPSLFEAPGQWGSGEPWGTPPPPEQGGPERRYGRLGGKIIKVPAPEGFVSDARPRYSRGFISDAKPYFVKVERGEMTAEEAIQELEREYTTQ